jgi:hypothetical protein
LLIIIFVPNLILHLNYFAPHHAVDDSKGHILKADYGHDPIGSVIHALLLRFVGYYIA